MIANEMVGVMASSRLGFNAISVHFSGGSINCIIPIVKSYFISFNYNLYYFEEAGNFGFNINTIGCYLPIHFTCASKVVVMVTCNYTTNCLGLDDYQN